MVTWAVVSYSHCSKSGEENITLRVGAHEARTIETRFLIQYGRQKMGTSQSVEVPGGGSEGYHVLKVRVARAPGMLVLLARGV